MPFLFFICVRLPLPAFNGRLEQSVSSPQPSSYGRRRESATHDSKRPVNILSSRARFISLSPPNGERAGVRGKYLKIKRLLIPARSSLLPTREGRRVAVPSFPGTTGFACRFLWRARSIWLPRFARVAQLDRASVSEAEGCGFDPRRAHQSSLSVNIVGGIVQNGFNLDLARIGSFCL